MRLRVDIIKTYYRCVHLRHLHRMNIRKQSYYYYCYYYGYYYYWWWWRLSWWW